MDFASQLANLQKTASAAQSRGNNNRDDQNRSRSPPRQNNRDNRPPPDHRTDHRRHQGSNNAARDNGRYDNSRDNHSSYGRQPDQKRQRRELDGPYRSAKWNNLKRAVDTLPKYRPPTEIQPCTHMCLLAITINDLPLEAIWRDWAERQSITISLICHAKEPNKVQSEWLKSRLLVEPPRSGRGNDFAPPTYHTRYPQWGSIEITRAMLDLCDESLKVGTDADMKDFRFSTNRYGFEETATALPKVDKVLFISETCLPIASLTDELLASPISVVNSRDTPNNGFSRQLQFEKIHSLVPLKLKADQWMMLSRPHLQFVMTMIPHTLWECFRDCNASDELYFPTALALLGIVDDESQLVKRRITYADWSMGPKNPATFETKDLKKVVEEARKEGCLVARKFIGIDLEEWKAVVFPSAT
jgi:hypothetical protein